MANLSSAPVLLEVTSRTPAILSTSFSRRRIPVKRVANSCWPNTPPPPLNFPFLSPFPLSLSLPLPCSYFRYFDFKKKKEIKRFRALCNRKVIVREDRVCIIETCTRRTEVGRMDVRESRSRWWKSTRGEDVFSLSFFPPFFSSSSSSSSSGKNEEEEEEGSKIGRRKRKVDVSVVDEERSERYNRFCGV